MDESKLSSEALQEDPADSKEDVQGVINGDNDELGDEDDVVAGGVEGEFGDIKPNGQLKELPPIEAQPVAQYSGQFSGSYPSSDVATSPQLLSEVPVDFDGQQPLELAEFKVKVEVSQLETPLSVATESAQTHLHSQIQSSGCPTFSSELSPTSVTESISSASPAFPDQKLSSATKTNDSLFPEVQQHNSSKPKPISADGFNWRKYGQKQVKLPQGSRSYYKCTYPNCHAKKTERSDHLNNVIETTPKGEHNHDPPPRTSSTKENILSLPAPQEGELKESDPPTPGLDELKQLTFSGSYEIVEFDGKKEHDDRPELKRRLKKSNPVSSKKRKIVIHAEGDVDIAGDGYRWRKYGQKMVKGSPHPRNYYRCTSAGCPVRKHLERAKDDTGNVMITYKGLHDHDMPVPKKGQGPQSASLLAAQASVNSLQLEKNGDNQVFDAQWLLESGGAPTGAEEEVAAAAGGGEEIMALDAAEEVDTGEELVESGGAPTGAEEEVVAAAGGGEEIMALDAAEEVDAGEEMVVVDGGEEVGEVGREMAAMEPSRTQPIKQC